MAKNIYQKPQKVSPECVTKAPFFTLKFALISTLIKGRYKVYKEYIRSWSDQLLINYILTIYVLYTKIGVCAYFAKYLQHIGL